MKLLETFEEFLSEIKWIDGKETKIKRGQIPLTPGIVRKILGGSRKVKTFHILDIDAIDKMKKIIGKRNTISSFTYFSKSYLNSLKGVQTQGGIVLYVEGTLNFIASTDIMSTLDTSLNRRWVDSNRLSYSLYTELLNSFSYKNIVSIPVIKEYMSKVYELLDKYHDEIKINLLNLLDTSYHNDWNEILVNNVKVIDIIYRPSQIFYDCRISDIEKENKEKCKEKNYQLISKLKELSPETITPVENYDQIQEWFKERGGFTDVKEFTKNEMNYLPDENKKYILTRMSLSNPNLSDEDFKTLLDSKSKIEWINKFPNYTNIEKIKMLSDEEQKEFVNNFTDYSMHDTIYDGLTTNNKILYAKLQSHNGIIIKNFKTLPKKAQIEILIEMMKNVKITKVVDGTDYNILKILKNDHQEVLYNYFLRYPKSYDYSSLLSPENQIKYLMNRVTETNDIIPYKYYILLPIKYKKIILNRISKSLKTRSEFFCETPFFKYLQLIDQAYQIRNIWLNYINTSGSSKVIENLKTIPIDKQVDVAITLVEKFCTVKSENKMNSIPKYIYDMLPTSTKLDFIEYLKTTYPGSSTVQRFIISYESWLTDDDRKEIDRMKQNIEESNKKIIRLTETQLKRVIQQVISEIY